MTPEPFIILDEVADVPPGLFNAVSSMFTRPPSKAMFVLFAPTEVRNSMAPEDNPADDVQPTKEEYDAAMAEPSEEEQHAKAVAGMANLTMLDVKQLKLPFSMVEEFFDQVKARDRELFRPATREFLIGKGFVAGRYLGDGTWIEEPASNIHRLYCGDLEVEGMGRWLLATTEFGVNRRCVSVLYKCGSAASVELLDKPTRGQVLMLLQLFEV